MPRFRGSNGGCVEAARAPASYTVRMTPPDPERSEGLDPDKDPDAQQWFAGDAFRGVLTPVLAGLLVDIADLVTFGPLGAWLGFGLGALVAWQLAPRFGFADRPWLPSLLAGLYCMTPGTALLPLATFVASILHLGSGRAPVAPPQARRARGGPSAPPTIEPEYSASWDDEDSEPAARKDTSDV